MIQLNASLIGTKDLLPGSIAGKGGQSALDSFESELSAALTSTLTTTLQKFGIDPSKVSISIGPAANAGTRSQAAAVATPAPATLAALADSAAAQDAIQAADNAYWSQQPLALQALRNIDDPIEREEAAAELAGQGFRIDVPIMVWGWDAAKVTELRRSYGYTWVPSSSQQPIQMAPGISGIGLNPYDPNNPPPGSITV